MRLCCRRVFCELVIRKPGRGHKVGRIEGDIGIVLKNNIVRMNSQGRELENCLLKRRSSVHATECCEERLFIYSVLNLII